MVSICTRAYRAIGRAVQGYRPRVAEGLRGLTQCETLEPRVFLSVASSQTSEELTQGLSALVQPQALEAPAVEVVSIPDAGLQAAIRSALGKPTGDITSEDMASLTSLSVTWENINDLTGLQYATNLESLNLSSNKISDVSPLSRLTKLTDLDVSYNQISDVSSLSELTQLTRLSLQGNQISDVSPLAGMTRLTFTNLFWNKIRDVSPLSEMTQLTGLGLSSNPISDLTSLSGLTQLTFMELASTQVSDLTPLSGMTELTYLYLASNQISDLTPLSNLTRLTRLYLQSNQIRDVTPLSALTQLTDLNLSSNRIGDVSPLSGLTKLTYLNVADSHVSDLTGLAGLSSLTRVDVSHNNLDLGYGSAPMRVIQTWIDRRVQVTYLIQYNVVQIPDAALRAAIRAALKKPYGEITDIAMEELTSLTDSDGGIASLSGLEYATNLQFLSLWGDPISDLRPLSGLTQLTELRLQGNYISDLSPLSAMNRLTYMQLANSQVSDLSPLAGLTQLTHLDLFRNKISDVSPLSGLTKLTYLELYGNQIQDLGPLAGLTQLGYLQVWSDQISDLSALAGLVQLTNLQLQGSQIRDLAPLSGLTRLDSLILTCGQLRDVSPLSGLTQLTFLGLAQCQISDLSPLTGLTQLTGLALPQNSIGDVTPLAALTQLQVLRLSGNHVSDLTPLAGLISLSGVDVNGNNLNVAPGSPSMIVIQGWLDKGVSVTYLPQNTMAPIELAVSSASVLRGWPGGTLVGMLSAIDPNPYDEAGMTFSLVGGGGSRDNGMFRIAGHKLRTNALIPSARAGSYRIRIRATDSGGLAYEKALTIDVGTNVAPADVVLSRARVAEHQASGTTVGTLTAVDANSVDSFTYSLVRGSAYPDNAAFSIVGDQLKTAGEFNFEATSSYSIRLRSTDRGGLFCEKTITVRVKNVNEAPTGIALSNSTVLQHLPAGTLVGKFVGTDPDALSALAYTLVGGIGSRDNAMFTILNGKLRTSSVLDDATQSVYKIRVRVTDQDELWYEKAMRVGVIF